MLHEAYYFSIGSLPEPSKSCVKQKLESTAISGSTKQEVEKIIQFMMQGTSLDGSLLREKIKEIDLLRNQDLNQHHAELAKIIAYE